jgi:hypothetical protein
MSNNKNKKRVYSKPTVEQPKEELIEEQAEEITEAKAIDPEVFETKLFVEEEPEEVIFTAPVPDELGEVTEFPIGEPVAEVPTAQGVEYAEDVEGDYKGLVLETHVDGEKVTEVLEQNHNVDAVEEFRKMVQAELEKPLGVDAEEELSKNLQQECAGQNADGTPYTLTPEQEEEGAKVIAEMVEEQILQELKEKALPAEPKIHGEYFFTEKQAKEEVKALSPEPEKDKTLDTLSQHELRHFHRTGQMPK